MKVLCAALILSFNVFATDWSKDAQLPGNEKCFISHGNEVCLKDGNRKNILELSEHKFTNYVELGSAHALNYPVSVTQLQLPTKAMEKFFNSDSRSPIRRFIFRITKKLSPFKNFDDLFNWIGLHSYPSSSEELGPNFIANMGELEKYPMGVSVFDNQGHESMTFSCAACHSNNLFGTKILGMSNRFPRANEVFLMGKKALTKSNPLLFRMLVGPSKEDLDVYKKSRAAIKYVGLKKPKALGLDTSLAQVGLSLARRGLDEYATKIPFNRRNQPRANELSKNPADSKPAVWWNLKYKTKWLSDASIVSGNPVHTNFLWNEIGRGVDLKELESWLDVNKKAVDALTAYVFNAEAPLYNDFFPNSIDISRAKRGEKLFLKSCKGCHGIYEKGWSLPNADELSYAELIATTKVWYHKKTIVKDIGTDPYRADGMNYFYKDLNRLKISKSIGTVVKPQKGYVPPPLVGIWSRWPYFHNNSVPTLYDVISLVKDRPENYISVPSEDKNLDFDIAKNGYPSKDLIKEPYRSDKEYFFNTKIKGLSNQGHEKMLVDDNGIEKFSHTDKIDLINYLKSL